MERHRTASLPLDDGPAWLARLRLATGGHGFDIEPGRVIVREGDAATSFHAVESGAVLVSATVPEGGVAALAILGAGETFGQDGFLTDPAGRFVRPAFRALVASRIVAIPIADVWLAVGRNPEIGRLVVASLTRSVERLQRRVAGVLLPRVIDRVAELFADLARVHGRPSADAVVIQVPLTQDLVASMVGATRESVNRAVRSLAASGAIRRAGRTYSVLDPPFAAAGLRAEGTS